MLWQQFVLQKSAKGIGANQHQHMHAIVRAHYASIHIKVHSDVF